MSSATDCPPTPTPLSRFFADRDSDSDLAGLPSSSSSSPSSSTPFTQTLLVPNGTSSLTPDEPPTPRPGSGPKQNGGLVVDESPNFRRRRARVEQLEREQAMEDMVDCTVTKSQLRSLDATFDAVKMEVADLDGLAPYWAAPVVQPMLEQWRSNNVPPMMEMAMTGHRRPSSFPNARVPSYTVAHAGGDDPFGTSSFLDLAHPHSHVPGPVRDDRDKARRRVSLPAPPPAQETEKRKLPTSPLMQRTHAQEGHSSSPRPQDKYTTPPRPPRSPARSRRSSFSISGPAGENAAPSMRAHRPAPPPPPRSPLVPAQGGESPRVPLAPTQSPSLSPSLGPGSAKPGRSPRRASPSTMQIVVKTVEASLLSKAGAGVGSGLALNVVVS